MSNRPPITYKPKVCVICEGLEEKIYFDRLTKIGVLNKHYRFFPQDAGGQAKIFAKFQAVYQNDNYDVILILCDTDKKPHKGYNEMRKRINEQFNSRTAVTNRIVIYTNPCTMQIVLSHFAEVELKTQSKSVNAPIIEKLTGVSGYKAKKKQIEDICKQITHTSYFSMKERIRKINKPFSEVPSTNFIQFLELFENDNDDWINEINKVLNKMQYE